MCARVLAETCSINDSTGTIAVEEYSMAGFLVLIFAVLSRLVPHLFGISAWGVTAMGGGLLFFGSRLPARERWKALLVVPLVAAMDWYLTTQIYGFPFHVAGYVLPWLWYAGVACFGSVLLSKRRTLLRVAGAALGSATGFFVLSNGLVWLYGSMYPRTPGGLMACFAAGLPFYRNDLLATLALCGVLFGLPVLARRLLESTGNGGIAI